MRCFAFRAALVGILEHKLLALGLLDQRMEWESLTGWKFPGVRPWMNNYIPLFYVGCNYACMLNSLAPGKFEWNFRSLIFQIISMIDGWGISCELTRKWMSFDLIDDKSILVQVMAWCCQATSHYLSQCWPRSLSPYGITKPQRVKFKWWFG